MNMNDEARLGFAVHLVQQALITTYKDIFLSDLLGKVKKSLRWTSELESLRREVRQLFNRRQADNNSSSWELYRRLNGDIERRYESLPKRLGGLSVAQ